MKISVALCTYNGERYLPDQLRSFVEQSRRPDELIVVDDRSTDGTVGVIRAFAAEAPFPVSVHVNDDRFGVTANFEKALGLCTGDVLFPSDQDDVWLPSKIDTLTRALSSDPGLLAVAANTSLIDGEGRTKPGDLWSILRVTAPEFAGLRSGAAFEVVVRKNVAAGMAMALRRELLALAFPIPRCWMHDWWLTLVAAAENRFAIVPEQLVRYRQHGRNVVGLEHMTTRARFKNLFALHDDVLRAKLAQMRAASERMLTLRPDRRTLIEQQIIHLEARLGMPPRRRDRFPLVARELLSGRYNRYSAKWLTAMKDLVRPA